MSGDKPIIYPEQIARSFDILHMVRDLHKSMSRIIHTFTGSSSAFVTEAGASEQVVPSLTINIAEGWIYQMAPLDATQWGTLPADNNLFMRLGYKAAHTVTFSTSGISSGQSRYALIEAKFTPSDQIRDGDPDAGVLAYFNSEDPTQPFNGPDDSGDDQPTVRLGTMTTQVTYGVSATTGSQVPPNVTSGFVPLYLVLLTNGQTTITNGQILVAGPSVGVGVPNDYPRAPFNKGLYGHHHTGGGGSAPQIDLTQEVSGVLPFANLPVTNTSPPSLSKIPVFGSGTTAPQGNRAGEVDDYFYHITSKVMYRCTTAGNAGTAVWEAVGIPETIVDTATTYSISGRIHKVYSLRPTANATFNLASAQSMLGSIITIRNDLDFGSVYTVTIDPNSTELVEGKTTIVLYPGQSITIYPRYISSTGSWASLSGPIGQAFGGNGGRQLPTSGALSGYYYHSGDWTSTGSLTAAPGTKIKVAGNMNILHTIDCDFGVLGGAGSANSAQAPASGNGPCPGKAVAADRCGGGGGGNGGKGGSGGSSTALAFATGGSAISVNEYFGGSSGGGGFMTGGDAGGKGGDAGGNIYLEVSGNLLIDGSILANGQAGYDGAPNNGAGGGGGSGGSIEARVGGNIDNTGGVIEAKGGNGGAGGGNSGGHGGKGAPGGGGQVVLWAGGTVTGGSNVNVDAGEIHAQGSSSQDATAADNGVYTEISSTRPSSRF